MNNNTDLRRLVRLLSYLKKHDDVESDIGKARAERRPDPGMRVTTPWERAQSGKTFTDDTGPVSTGTPSQRGWSTAAGGSAPAYQIDESPAQAGLPSSVPPSSTQEIRDPSIPITPYKDYYPQGGEIGPRGGHFDTLGDTPVESVTAPDSMQEDDTSDDTTEDERDLVQWFRDEGYTLAELKQMIEDFTAPSKQQQIKGPEHYARHTKPQFSKSNESTILNLFYRLGI